MSKEQIVRDTAYAIWEAEGKPDGRAQDHWSKAEKHVAASEAGNGGKTAPKSVENTDAAKLKAPAKAAPAKSAPAKVAPAKAAPDNSAAAKAPAKKKS